MLDARQSLLNKGLRALTPLPAFEDVLDQRVAAALRRLGFPDAVELARMREQITDLQQRLEAPDSVVPLELNHAGPVPYEFPVRYVMRRSGRRRRDATVVDS